MLVQAFIIATAFSNLPQTENCATNPFQLEIRDLARFGEVAEKARRHCSSINFSDTPQVPGRTYIIGRTQLFRFRLLGGTFRLGLRLISQPVNDLEPGVGLARNGFGNNPGGVGTGRLYVSPVLDLPGSWDQELGKQIDKIAGPVALTGGVLLTTAVLVGVLAR